MNPGLRRLTERQLEVLRLLAHGHDAKSIAAALDVSVHTVNERLREARRKLGVSSSREAARQLLASESGQGTEKFVAKYFGIVPPAPVPPDAPSSARRRSGRRSLFAAAIAGGLIMILAGSAVFFSSAGRERSEAPPRAARMTTPTLAALREQDFPRGETPRGASVGFRVNLDASGSITECAVTRSSGVSVLDMATCPMVRASAKFDPAIGAEGRPIESQYSGTIDWKVASLR